MDYNEKSRRISNLHHYVKLRDKVEEIFLLAELHPHHTKNFYHSALTL